MKEGLAPLLEANSFRRVTASVPLVLRFDADNRLYLLELQRRLLESRSTRSPPSQLGSTGPAVILLHGFGVDALDQFGDFERIRSTLEERQQMFREIFGGALPFPDPPVEGRAGLAHALRAAGARTILPDMRGFGSSDKPREKEAYAASAMARTSSHSSSTFVWKPWT